MLVFPVYGLELHLLHSLSPFTTGFDKKSSYTKHFVIFVDIAEDLRGHWGRLNFRVLSIIAHMPFCPILSSLLVPSRCLLLLSCPCTRVPVFFHPAAISFPLLLEPASTSDLGASHLPKAFPHKKWGLALKRVSSLSMSYTRIGKPTTPPHFL